MNFPREGDLVHLTQHNITGVVAAIDALADGFHLWLEGDDTDYRVVEGGWQIRESGWRGTP